MRDNTMTNNQPTVYQTIKDPLRYHTNKEV